MNMSDIGDTSISDQLLKNGDPNNINVMPPASSGYNLRHSSQDNILGRTCSSPKLEKVEPVQKARKKPGPKPGSKSYKNTPIKKNDLEAKKGVIREIEKFWGTNFIRQYVPKVRRPLVKRPPGPKRKDTQRYPQNDPKYWQPAVLKAVLMVAQKCGDKIRLRRLMNEAVEYRIKHTGNLKPQLVTTDFDVIEDVIEKGWTIPQSFSVRYKHLTGGRSFDLEEEGDGQDQELVDASDDAEDAEKIEDGDSFNDDDSIGFHELSAFQPNLQQMQALGQQPLPQLQYQPTQYINPYGRAHLQGNYQVTPPQSFNTSSERRRSSSHRDHTTPHQYHQPQQHQQQHQEYPYTLQPQNGLSSSSSPPSPSSSTRSMSRLQVQSSPYELPSSPLLLVQHPPGKLDIKPEFRSSSLSQDHVNQKFPTPDTYIKTGIPPIQNTYSNGKMGFGEPVDDDDEFLKAQLEVAEAKEKRAELKLQVLERKRMKNM
ncbi:uncharacterized protein BDR25DRAFT_366515 [Lindgomyces ingoldianus]|uniref:Uncharacterized protein n=1 Tax=Lindgomyces ingoldianus TaxID=673940 RepID=A0ACB6R2G1_9PLEO|nr:uncharacterized protein BDR25DRAFT_366515 [Lindgomyces ingoldianus]KAF2472522.1 hypothetical protein BDR25DRAFT_366515 [Lindgomyces ingoldianus]